MKTYRYNYKQAHKASIAKSIETKKQVNFSAEQLDIFAWFLFEIMIEVKNLIVIARAGVGKTFTILEAILRFLTKFLPSEPGLKVLYGVFNKKNQIEAKEKVQAYNPELLTNGSLTISTWHSVGFSFIRSQWGNNVKASNGAEWNRVEKICPELKEKKYLIFLVISLVSMAKNRFAFVPPAEEIRKLAIEKHIEANKKDLLLYPVEKLAEIACKVLEISKERTNEISFDDMVFLPVVCDMVSPCYDLIVGDEAQDLNLLQLEILQRAIKPQGRICLVGDDKQAIYAFRGALANGLETMKEKLQAGILKLTETFRCPKKVVELAIPYASDYKASESNPDGEILNCNDEEMISQTAIGDCILSRKNAPLMRYCLKLIQKNKTAKIEGKDVARDLIRIAESLDCQDFSEFANKLGIWETVQIGKQTGYNATEKVALIQDKAQTLRVLSEACVSLQDLTTKLDSMFTDSKSEYARPCILLSTVHKAKGLEWNKVFIIRETFFMNHPLATEEDLEQEKNMYYVAVTRTKQTLVMVSPKI